MCAGRGALPYLSMRDASSSALSGVNAAFVKKDAISFLRYPTAVRWLISAWLFLTLEGNSGKMPAAVQSSVVDIS